MSKRRATRHLTSILLLSTSITAVTAPTSAWAQVISADLLGRLTDLESRSAASDASLLKLQTQTSGNAATLVGQQSAVAKLDANVDSLDTDLDALRTSLDTDIGALRTDSNAVRSTVGALGTQLKGTDVMLGDVSATVTKNGKRLDAAVADIASVNADVSDLRKTLIDGVDLGVIDVDDIDDLGDVLKVVNRQGSIITNNVKEVREVRTDISSIQVHDKLQDTRIDASEKVILSHDVKIRQNSADIEAQGEVLAEHSAHMAAQDLQMSRSAKAIAANSQAIDDLSGMMDDVQDKLDSQDRRIDKASEGVAMALAMKSPTVPDNKNFALSGSFGAFENHTALALAGGVRATDTIQLDAGLAVGLDRGSVGGRAGATIAW